MYEAAKLTGYMVDQEGTTLRLLIRGKNYQEQIITKEIRSCGVWLDDGRHITAEQRKKAYAVIRDISAYTGYMPEEQKEWMKYLYIMRTGGRYISLSSCSVGEAREFINVLLDYALENGIPLAESGIDRTDDADRYLYACMLYRKCAVCGRAGEIHHWDAVGMGRDRTQVDDSGLRKVCLCRTHHTECHTIGNAAFRDKYRVYGIIQGSREHL